MGSSGVRLLDGELQRIYGADVVHERHSNRYEVDPVYVTDLERKGLHLAGVSVEDVAAYTESLMPDRGGVGRFPVKAGRAAGWVHVDTRADKARWRG